MQIEIKRVDKWCLVRVTVEGEERYLVSIADAHCGASTFNEKQFKKTIQFVIDHNALWFGNGDLMENANKNSVGAGWVEQLKTPEEQIEYLISMFEPIKKNCIGMTMGNHEARTYKTTGINPLNSICRALDVPFCGYSLMAVINRAYKNGGTTSYSLFANHSNTAHKNAGLTLNAIERDWFSWLDVDIVCKGHDHNMGFTSSTILRLDKRNLAVATRQQYAWSGGHYLDWRGSYNEMGPSKPKPMGTIALRLGMDKNKRSVTPEYVL